jgi:hypothetical protein
MRRFSFTGSFNLPNSTTQTLLVLPRTLSGTFAISNNSRNSFVVLLNGIESITVRPFGIARIGITQSGRISIRTRAMSTGSFIFQQN